MLQVRLPPKYRFESKIMDDGQRLRSVYTQESSKIHSGIYNIAFDAKEKMDLRQFKMETNKIRNTIGEVSIENVEDIHWERLEGSWTDVELPVPKYAIDNALTLFQNCENWNLNRFQYKESIIHSVCYSLLISMFFCVHNFFKVNSKHCYRYYSAEPSICPAFISRMYTSECC